MKKCFVLLVFLFFIAARPGFSAYEDFSSYHGGNGPTYSKKIDNCNADPGSWLDTYTYVYSGRTTSITTSVMALTTLGYMSYDMANTKEGGRSFVWDKTGTATDTSTITTTIAAWSGFRTTNLIGNYYDWRLNSNLTFWYYIPASSSSSSVTLVEMYLSTDTGALTGTPSTVSTNSIQATQTTGITAGSWNFFRRPFLPGIYSDGNTSVSTTYITTYPTFSHVFSSIGTYTQTVTTAQMQQNFPDYSLYTITSVVTATGTHTSTTTAIHTSTITVTNNITQSNFPDYTQFKQYQLGIRTDATTSTFIGIRVDDICLVDPNGWTGGTWNEIGGVWKIVQDGTEYVYAQLGDCSTPLNTSVYTTVSPTVLSKYGVSAYNDYTDFTYSAKVKIIDSGATYGALAFRFTPNKYYLLNLNNSAGQLELKKYDGGFTTLASYATTVSTNTYYYLRAVCKGSNIKGYISTDGITWGNPVIDATDASSLPSGKIGLFAGGPGTKIVYFGQVKVLPTPLGLTAAAKENSVDLTWSISAGRAGEVLSYNIYRKDSVNGYSLIGTSTSASYTDSTAKGETSYSNPTSFTQKQYTYKVSANIADGLGESDFSNEANATPYTSLIVKMATFTPTTNSPLYSKVSFTLYSAVNDTIEVKIYDINGSLVKTLTGNAGALVYSTVAWDGKDESGALKESGVYIYQVKLGGTRKGTGTVCLAR